MAARRPGWCLIVFTVRYSSESRDESRTFDLVPSTPGYLDALGARLVAGRFFTADDTRSEQSVAVLSETALEHLGKTVNVVGKELIMALPSDGGPRVKPIVIGVVRDVRYAGFEAPADGNVYVLWRQIPLASGFLTVRAAGDPTALTAAIREIVRAADPSMRRPRSRLHDLRDPAARPDDVHRDGRGSDARRAGGVLCAGPARRRRGPRRAAARGLVTDHSSHRRRTALLLTSPRLARRSPGEGERRGRCLNSLGFRCLASG